MRFGICVDASKAGECQSLGFDYAECKINSLAAMAEDEFQSLCNQLDRLEIRVEAGSLLFPKTMDLNTVSDEELEEYLEKAFSRMERIGAEVAVVGSGKSRYVPEGAVFKSVFRRLVDQTRKAGEIASRHNVRIAIEPLNLSETNLINSLKEGAMLECAASSDSVGLLADLYHMRKEGESMDEIVKCSPLIHAHIAVLEKRGFPVEMTDEVSSFFKALKSAGYDGRMSIEGKADDWKSASIASLKTLRALDKE